MTIEEIREILALFNESGVAEMEVQRADNRVRLKRASLVQEYVMPQAPQAMYAAHPAPLPYSVSSGAAAAAPAREPVEAEGSFELVKSPIVGTFFESSSPSSAPFIKIGDRVTKGQILCIIESMKLMNEIEAEASGVVAEKLVENAQPVEYGQPLFKIRTA